MNYYIKTFGCQMNISDSERIESFMLSQGFSVSDNIKKADVIIINTCGIRQMAEDRVFGMVRNLKKDTPKIQIVVTGCLASRKDIHRRMKDVDLFFPIKEFDIFKNWLIDNSLEIENLPADRQGLKLKISANIKNSLSNDKISYLTIQPIYKSRFQAYVPIMTGCDNFCSYCVVPYARGREVSRPASEILDEIEDLVKKGYKSITLLGQNVNSYKDSSNKNEIKFTLLLKKIDKISGKFWIHFVSSHPKDMSGEIIENLSKLKKVCENIHLPVQSGDDKILKKMNRKYTKADYLKLIKKIKSSYKKNKPDFLYSITSDMIVGFPGETKGQFENSAEVMKKAKFDMVFFGQYSPRPGTVAWKMKDCVSVKEKERREKFLNEILIKTAFANNKKYVGKTLEILVEKEKNGDYFGKTRTLKNVRVVTEKKNLVGKLLNVEITKANIWSLEGKIK